MDIIGIRRILLICDGYHRLSSDIIALRWMSSTILFPATSPVDNEEAVLVRALLTTAQQESPLGSGCTDAAHEPPVGKEIPTGSGCTNAAHEPPVGKEIPTGSDCTNAAHEPPGPSQNGQMAKRVQQGQRPNKQHPMRCSWPKANRAKCPINNISYDVLRPNWSLAKEAIGPIDNYCHRFSFGQKAKKPIWPKAQ